jgi:fructose-1,6-bisphosphatase/inositol monophosphatase family enzyme
MLEITDTLISEVNKMIKSTKINNNKLEKFLKDKIVEAGHATYKLLGKTGVKYTKENSMDVVTKADLLSNKIIVNAIKKNFPTHGIISEEQKDENINNEYVWIIDPIDGTLNYSRGIPLYGVFIALAKNKEIIMGASYLPAFKELYFAQKGKGAFLNGRRVKCGNTKTIVESYGMIGSVWRKGRDKLTNNILSLIGDKTAWIGSLGSAAVNAGHVSCGKKDWTIMRGGGIWDYAAAVILLREAGCKVTKYDGSEWKFGDKEIVAANPILHKEVLRITKDA